MDAVSSLHPKRQDGNTSLKSSLHQEPAINQPIIPPTRTLNQTNTCPTTAHENPSQHTMQAVRSSLRARAAVASARSFSTSPSHSIARIIVTGRLAAEPEIQATSTGQDVVKYVVGTSYGPKDNRQTSWFRIASFQPEGPSRDHLLSLQKG